MHRKSFKTWAMILLVAATCLAATACNKRCRCTRNNLTVDYYTPDELEARGKSCAEMVYLEGLATKYYNICEWEY